MRRLSKTLSYGEEGWRENASSYASRRYATRFDLVFTSDYACPHHSVPCLVTKGKEEIQEGKMGETIFETSRNLMSSSTAAPAAQLDALARAHGLILTPAESGTDFSGNPTVRATFALATEASKRLPLELGERFDANDSKYADELNNFFAEAAQRLRNPRPECYFSLLGLPLSLGNFAWPFHSSTSGADTFIVHGEVRLETGGGWGPQTASGLGQDSTLHAKVSASLTRTFAEVVAALEQPFAESFIYNAVRKTLDQGQLELVKSGNRQPVPVTTRYHSAKQNRFIFNDTTEEQRRHFLAGKIYWLSDVLGGGAPVWVTDPRDAQYLNTTGAELAKAAMALATEGLLTPNSDGSWASATAKLKEQRERFEAEVEDGLKFIKPSFNEEMRAGHTNM
jgi:hypothetical protein